jgi:hypothetical protein
MEKVELKPAQDFGDDDSILCRHVHSYQQHGRTEIHAHQLSQY